MTEVHRRLAVAVVVLAVVGAGWAAVSLLRRRPSGGLAAYLWLTEAAIAAQAVLGIGLALRGYRPDQGIHFFYGPAVLLTLPVTFVMARGPDARRETWVLLCGCVVLLLISVRAVATGGG